MLAGAYGSGYPGRGILAGTCGPHACRPGMRAGRLLRADVEIRDVLDCGVPLRDGERASGTPAHGGGHSTGVSKRVPSIAASSVPPSALNPRSPTLRSCRLNAPPSRCLAVTSQSWNMPPVVYVAGNPPSGESRPVAANTMTAPHANTSAAGPARCPANTSGAMQLGVPATSPVLVSDMSTVRAMPKSITRGPSGPSSTLSGLRSRWMTPASWIAVSAVATAVASRCRSSRVNRRPPSTVAAVPFT